MGEITASLKVVAITPLIPDSIGRNSSWLVAPSILFDDSHEAKKIAWAGAAREERVRTERFDTLVELAHLLRQRLQ